MSQIFESLLPEDMIPVSRGASPGEMSWETVEALNRVTGDGLYAAIGGRAPLLYNPAAKSDGAIAGTLTADTGQALTAFSSPTDPAPLTISSGVITHATSGGATSAGYLQADLGAQVTRFGAMMSWPTSALGVVAMVLPSASWSEGVLPDAGFHLVISGNGVWTLTRFTTGGSTEIASYATHGRPGTAWGAGMVPLDIYIDAPNQKAVIVWWDGSTSVIESAFFESETSQYAIWELFANVGGTDVAPSLGTLWASKEPIDADVISPIADLGSKGIVQSNVLGAISVDASRGTHFEFTLVGNVTSFNITNAPSRDAEIRVTLIQDATGSRTLGGVNAAIKFSGATTPTLTATASRRDSFLFTTNTAQWFEVGRSLNVPI